MWLVVPQTMELRDDFLHERYSSDWTPLRPLGLLFCPSTVLPVCRTLSTNNCFLFLKKRKGKTEKEKKKKNEKKKKKEEFSTDYLENCQ